jgi:acyl-CoA dehydrogenase
MIDFELTPQQQNLREMVHWFAANRVRPLALEADRTGRYPEDFLRELQALGAAQGFTGAGDLARGDADAPKGEKQTNRTAVLLAEEMAWGDPAVLTNIPGPGLGAPPVAATGTPEQKERFFGMFKDTSKLLYGAYGLSEPGAGSDVAGIATSARKDGDHYVLNGTKCFITNGARAVWVVVFATIDKALGRNGHRAFVVEQGTPGFRVGRIERKMGLHAQETAELVFDDCRVHRDHLLGGEAYYEQKGASGFKIAMAFFDTTRPMVAILAVGIARAAYEIAREWVAERYGRHSHLPEYVLAQDRLARMEREIRAARLLAWKAAWMADLGLANSNEASMSKAYAGTIATQVCSGAVELLGPDGLYHQNLVEKLFRDVKVFDIFEGTGQIQRVVVSRRIFETMSN